jgi:hypothetical protein
MADNQDILSPEDLLALHQTYIQLHAAGDPRADKLRNYLVVAGKEALANPQANQTKFEQERDPANQPGMLSSAASEVGNIVKGIPAAAKALTHPVDTALGQAADLAINDQLRKNNGRSTGYRAAAAVAAPLGINTTGMERQADVGNAAGVAGTAIGDAVPYAAPLAAGAASKALRPVLSAASDRVAPAMYQSALKPPVTAALEKTAGMVSSGLENKVPISASGIEKIGSLIDNLNQKVTDTIASQPGKTINKFAVTSRLADTADTLSKQVNPSKDLSTVAKAGNEFLQTQPGAIPAADAQAVKVGTYKQIAAKYGQMGVAQVEAEKALARGIKEELANAFPELNQLNSAESKLLDLQPALERAVSRSGNHQLVGIGTPIAGGAAGIATGSAPVAAAVAAMKAIVDNPNVKSHLAIAIYTASKDAGKAMTMAQATAKVAAYSSALSRAIQSKGLVPSAQLPGQTAAQ